MTTLDALTLAPGVEGVLHRTLRIPDDGRDYPLPPSLGRFPIVEAPDGLFAPMHAREALWLGFEAPYWKPHALKVGIGGIDVLSGAPFVPNQLDAGRQDYVVIPDQPWLDGINAGDGFVRQFVAVQLGEGLSVEADRTGDELLGGLQLSLFAPRPGRFPDEPPATMGRLVVDACMPTGPEMGLGAGGRMRQEIYDDVYGIETWLPDPVAKAEVILLEAHAFAASCGVPVPPTPVDASTYAAHGLPWFELYDPARPAIGGSQRLAVVRSVRDRAGEGPDPSIDVDEGQTITLGNRSPRDVSEPAS